MKMIKHFIPVVVVFVFVTGLLVAGHLKTTINNPPIVQASSKEACPTDKITDRRAFVEGVFFVQDMKYRALCDTKDILAGLDGVEVLVEALHPFAEKHGLTRQVLQTDAELRLRMHGIKVGTDIRPQYKKLNEQTITETAHSSLQNWRQAIDAESDEDFLQFARERVRRNLFETSRPPRLYINLTTLIDEERHDAAFSIRVELKEMAYLSRNGAFCSAPVWYTSNVATCPSSKLKDFVRESLRDDVDEFINAYLAANAKDRSSQNEQ